MSRGTPSLLRCMLVWLAITAVGFACWSQSVAPITALIRSQHAYASFADLLVGLSAAALVVATGWLWLVATYTVATLVSGRVPRVRTGVAGRLVLMLCGAALAASTAIPAHATGTSPSDGLLHGLALPDRASAPIAPGASTPRDADSAPALVPSSAVAQLADASAVPKPTALDTTPVDSPAAEHTRTQHVVEPGDSLWAIAAAHHPADADLDQEWRGIWEHNRAVIGADPGLILPGQVLDLPGNTEGGQGGAR